MSNENSTRILIQRQAELVLKGKDTITLIELLEDLELDPLASSLQDNEMELLIHAYIIGGRYLDLNSFLQRYNLNFEYINHAKQACQAQCYHKLKELLECIKRLASVTKHELKDQLVPSAKKYILKSLGKCYKNFQLSTIKKNYQISQQQLRQWNYEIVGGYVEFVDEEPEISQEQLQSLMLERLKQVANVTQSVIEKSA